jgi:hypothetical protein
MRTDIKKIFDSMCTKSYYKRLCGRYHLITRANWLHSIGADTRLLSIKQVNDCARIMIKLTNSGIEFNTAVENVLSFYERCKDEQPITISKTC